MSSNGSAFLLFCDAAAERGCCSAAMIPSIFGVRAQCLVHSGFTCRVKIPTCHCREADDARRGSAQRANARRHERRACPNYERCDDISGSGRAGRFHLPHSLQLHNLTGAAVVDVRHSEDDDAGVDCVDFR